MLEPDGVESEVEAEVWPPYDTWDSQDYWNELADYYYQLWEEYANGLDSR